MKKILLALLAVPLIAFGQTYPSPTFSSLTLQNPLTAANGGTGTTTSTGTGSAVLSNSPTLVTPNLGIPSAVTLTNGTGLPVSTGISGLGTGVAVGLGNAATGSGAPVLATSPSVSNLTVTGSLTATGLIGLSAFAPQSANTVLVNATGSSASPTAYPMPGCSTSSSALNYTSNTGIGCNSAINAASLGGATFAAPGPIGSTTASTGAFTTLSASGTVSGTGFSTYLASPPAIGGTAANAGSFTTLSASTANPSLNYLASGTGAVSRSYASKSGDVISVKDYGATGNGSTNDTTAVTSAITAACGSGAGNTPGGSVYFPPGNYLLSPITITQSNCYLIGAGAQATIITPASTSSTLFTFSGAQFNGISNLYINYTSTPTAGAAIGVTGSQAMFDVHNVSIFGAMNGVYDQSSGGNHWYTNMTIYNTVATTGVAMTFTGFGNDEFLKNITINAPAGSQPAAGIEVVNNGAIWIDSVDVIHSGIGLLIQPSVSTDSVTWAFVSNSAFDTNSGTGILIQSSVAGQVIKGLNFVNTWTSSNTGRGILIQGSAGTIDGIRFVGHRSFNNGLDGAAVSYGNNIEFNACDMLGNSQTTNNSASGISMSISNFMVTSCRTGAAAGFGATQKYGILVNTGAFNNYIITNNNTQGNATGGIQDNGTGGTKVVTNNL